MSLQSEQFARNGLRKLLLLTGSGVLALAAAGLLTYGYLHGRAYRQERSQWANIQALATAKDFGGCRSQANAVSSRSPYFEEAQRLAQRCGLGVAQQQAADQDFSGAIATALSLAPQAEPLRAEAETLVQDWSAQIIAKGQQQYDAGQLDQAIATLGQIPTAAPAAATAMEKAQQWQATWDSSEAVLTAAEQLLDKGQWLAAKTKLGELPKAAHWQQKKQPLLDKAEAGIAEVAAYEAEQARQRAIAAAPRYDYQTAAPAPINSPNGAPQAAYAPPSSGYNPSAFDQRVESLYNSYVAQGQNTWDAWVQACQASGGYVVDQGPHAGCLP